MAPIPTVRPLHFIRASRPSADVARAAPGAAIIWESADARGLLSSLLDILKQCGVKPPELIVAQVIGEVDRWDIVDDESPTDATPKDGSAPSP